MRFSRQGYRSGLPFPSPGDLPNPGIKPGSPTLQADSSPSEPSGKRFYTIAFVPLTYSFSQGLAGAVPRGFGGRGGEGQTPARGPDSSHCPCLNPFSSLLKSETNPRARSLPRGKGWRWEEASCLFKCVVVPGRVCKLFFL